MSEQTETTSPVPEGAWAEVGPNRWRMHHHVVGPATDAPPVLFLHGSGPGASGWSNFHENAETLRRAGFQSILLDALGYGLSDKPTDTGYGLDVMSGAAVGVMDALGHERFSIVGNSQGGAQAIRIALDHPDRVDRLILMAPGGLEERDVYMQMRGIRSMLRCIYGPEGITLAGMKKVFEKQLYDSSQLDMKVIEARYQVAMTQPRHVFETMRVDNQEDRLGELRCPVLGFWGVNDLFCPVSGAAKLAERVPDARVVTLSRCGHWVMVEHQRVFDHMTIDFLSYG